MSVLWMGCEDIGFQQGTPAVNNNQVARTGYSRTGVTGSAASTFAASKPFPGGPVTSCWFSFQVHPFGNALTSMLCAGLTSSAVNTASGLWIGSSAGSSNKIGLFTYNAGSATITSLATETGTNFGITVNHRIDMQIASFGASAEIFVYADGALVIHFSGDVGMSGVVTSIDTVGVMGQLHSGISNFGASMGEFFVLTDCTLPYSGLVTGALTGAGTTDQWTGIFSDINQAAYSDATPNHDNLAGNNQQYNLTDLPTAPAGGWAIPAVKIEARSKKSPGSTLAHLKLGYNSGGSVAFGTGANKALTSSDETYEQIDQINPVTSTVFTESEINALQSNMQSAT